jgi:hypothetical protein
MSREMVRKTYRGTGQEHRPSGGQADLDIQPFQSGADAANYFAGPELFAKENQRAVFKSADGAEKIVGEGGMVCVDAAAG